MSATAAAFVESSHRSTIERCRQSSRRPVSAPFSRKREPERPRLGLNQSRKQKYAGNLTPEKMIPHHHRSRGAQCHGIGLAIQSFSSPP